ncbi:MAG: GIY-YIG nuclease family protein [Flavobacteriales bacterium]|nr:GIY-YIG nuclease family protein [Flavobacteriales bacterium]
MKFAVVDIETTGSYSGANSITEIAVVVTDGTKEIDRFESLVRPDHRIPLHITELTGITNDMVAEAPAWDDISDEIEDILSDCIFVAHNVGFDYSIIKKQFEERGRKWNRPKQCTVRLTRRIVPGLKSYSLSNLCRHFHVVNQSAHRAMADVEATLDIFQQLIKLDQKGIIQDAIKKGNPESWLPHQVTLNQYESLPEEPGVYYFRDAKGAILYIGMSKNIKSRIKQHFTGKLESQRRQNFLTQVASFDHVLTGTELVARIFEDHEIRMNWPPYNYAQKQINLHYGIYSYLDQSGYLRWCIQKVRKGSKAIKKFTNGVAARDFLFKIAREESIHPAFFGLPGPNDLKVESKEHNSKMTSLAEKIENEDGAFVIIDKGRHHQERSIIAFKNMAPIGFGFLDREEPLETWMDVMACCSQKVTSSATSIGISVSYLEKSNPFILSFDDASDPIEPVGNKNQPSVEVGENFRLF